VLSLLASNSEKPIDAKHFARHLRLLMEKRKNRLANWIRQAVYETLVSWLGGKLERKDRVHTEEGLACSAVCIES
jgi:hypothetical protein